MSCSRHGDACTWTTAAREAFDAWMDAEKRFVRGEVTHRELHELKSAYHAARDERLRECEGASVS